MNKSKEEEISKDLESILYQTGLQGVIYAYQFNEEMLDTVQQLLFEIGR